jgi:hypothetical protein
MGPGGPRFAVVDYDATRNKLYGPHDGDFADTRDGPDRFKGIADADLIEDRVFRAQNAYAVAARTLAAFESALGRRIPWSFAGHQLYLVPSAFHEANAYYDGDSDAVLFGYFERSDSPPVYLSLSHDVIAHETTHAVLDGLRSRFEEPGLPDQLAFHEAFADLVALLLAFSMPEVVGAALGGADPKPRIPVGAIAEAQLKKTILFGLAEEFGIATGERQEALRRSVDLEPKDVRGWRERVEFLQVHHRGEILVAAVARAFLAIWRERLEALVSPGDQTLNLERAAEEGAKSAQHLLGMLIRAIDYCPPLEFEYEDYLAALLTADEEVAPDDDRHYRDRLVAAFRDFEIVRGGWVAGADQLADLDYGSLNAIEYRARRDEAYRFLWINARRLGIPRHLYTLVDSVLPSTRVGPDGLFVQESILMYRQMLNGTAGELATLSQGKLELPPGLDPRTKLQLHGGGVIVLDQFGRAKYHHRKPLREWDRQTRRLAHLHRQRVLDTRGQIGFSSGTAEGQRFAVLHESDRRAAEAW